jgi:ribonuclease Z
MRVDNMGSYIIRHSIRIAFFGFLSLPSIALGQSIKVTLLGTGCPRPVMNRFGASTLVQAGSQTLLVDAGRGALQRLTQVKVRWQDVTGVLLTHLHSDHVVGFPDLFLTGWLIDPGRSVPLPVWGPDGTTEMMSHLTKAFAEDIRVRTINERASPAGAALQAKDIRDGVFFDADGVKVTAFEVDHAPVKSALGYRIDYAGRSVVLSGDTRVSENLVRHAAGTDLLIHEVLVPQTLRRTGVPPDRIPGIVAYHTTPEQAGEVFARVRPRLAVYSHVCPPTATEEDLRGATRRTYHGPFELGEDLMVVEVGEQITIQRPTRGASSLDAQAGRP